MTLRLAIPLIVLAVAACDEARGPADIEQPASGSGGEQLARDGARRSIDSVVFAGAGNIATCTNHRDAATAALLDTLPGFVFTTGDNAFPHGTAQDYAGCYDPAWGRLKNRTFAVMGNHEYDDGTAAAAFDYFGHRAGPRGQGYYSVNLGRWHVIVLNDNSSAVPFAAGSAQLQWLQADLAANTRRCTLALWHQPYFLSSNSAGFTTRPSRKVLWAALAAAGVDLVVNGHQHHYERMAPMTPDGTLDWRRGIRQFNVGTGGSSLALPTVALHPNSEIRASAYGVLKLTLRDVGYDWEFLPIAGESFRDQGSGLCH